MWEGIGTYCKIYNDLRSAASSTSRKVGFRVMIDGDYQRVNGEDFHTQSLDIVTGKLSGIPFQSQKVYSPKNCAKAMDISIYS